MTKLHAFRLGERRRRPGGAMSTGRGFGGGGRGEIGSTAT
jgi:hypothetical protein